MIFIAPKRNLELDSNRTPESLWKPNLLSVSGFAFFWTFHAKGFTQYVTFCVWLFSLSIMVNFFYG